MKMRVRIASWIVAAWVIGLCACHEEGRIGAIPPDPDEDASIIEELPQDVGGDADGDVVVPDAGEVVLTETFGQACTGPEECASGICFSYKVEDDEAGFCTFDCQGRCPIDDHVCFLDRCVPVTYCESDSGGGLGPGCDGSPCERCADDEQCVAGAERGRYLCVGGD